MYARSYNTKRTGWICVTLYLMSIRTFVRWSLWCTGVTGGRSSNQARVQGLIKQLREVTDDNKSIAVGFGVSGPDQVDCFLLAFFYQSFFLSSVPSSFIYMFLTRQQLALEYQANRFERSSKSQYLFHFSRDSCWSVSTLITECHIKLWCSQNMRATLRLPSTSSNCSLFSFY